MLHLPPNEANHRECENDVLKQSFCLVLSFEVLSMQMSAFKASDTRKLRGTCKSRYTYHVRRKIHNVVDNPHDYFLQRTSARCAPQ